MLLSEKTLTCTECGAAFAFTVNEPKRCPTCRQTRRPQQRGYNHQGPREMYPVICAQCGAQAQVPFQPRGDKPVYCSDCFSRTRANSYR
jgi:CxxC-x17-CxxC domain-containing protein